MKRRILLLVFTVITTVYADGTDVILSLKKYAKQGDTTGLKKTTLAMNDAFSEYTSAEYSDALDLCILKAEKDKSPFIQEFHTLKAKWYQYNNEISKAASEYSKVYEYLKKSNRESEAVWILIEIGNLFYATDNYSDATIFYKKAEALCEKLKDKYALSVINLNLGLIETANENYSDAVRYLQKCIRLREGTKENAFISHTYIKLAEIYEIKNQPDSVLYFIKAAEQLYYAEGTNVGLLQNMPAMIGMAYYRYFASTGNSRIAEVNLLKAREFIRKKNQDSRLYDSFITEAEFELADGNAQKVVDSLSYILPKLAGSRYFDMYKTALHLLAKASYDIGSYKACRNYYERYISLDEETVTKMSIQNSDVSGIFDKASKAKNETDHVVTEQKDPLSTILLILLTASLGVVVYLNTRLNQQKKKNSELRRELDRQRNDFTDKLRKRAESGN